MQLSDRIGRRLKLHDLHVLMSVVQSGSMGKAAALLHTTQSAISRSIAELEHAVGVRLLDRSRQGVAPTEYGRALLEGGAAVFDGLSQAVKRIEFLADPTVGSLTVGATEMANAGLLPAIFLRLRRRNPGLSMHVTPVPAVAQQYQDLRERKVDLIVGRIPPAVDKDIEAEILLRDPIVVAAGANSPWARRRGKVELSQLMDEPWALPPLGTLISSVVADVFRSHGMDFPPRGAATGSIHLCSSLVATGIFLAMFPKSVLRLADSLPPLKILPVKLPIPAWPVGIMTLKNRMPSPVAKLFIQTARDVTRPLGQEAL
jgi:DNA-binding transcriptional LysR family regulator